MGICVHQGRIFAAADQGRRVAVIAASVAQLAWPGQDPIGRRFRLGPGSGAAIEVVGVVGDIRGLSLTADPTLDVYLPYWQSDMSLNSDQVSLVLSTEGDGARSLSRGFCISHLERAARADVHVERVRDVRVSKCVAAVVGCR